jgi:hypothetical protein
VKHASVLATFVLVGAAGSHASTCTSTSFVTGGASCTESLTNVGGIAGADETLTMSDFTQGAEITSSAVDLNESARSPLVSDIPGLAGFDFDLVYINTYPEDTWTIVYTATITSCAIGFACAISGYFEDQAQGGAPNPYGGIGLTLTGEPPLTLGSFEIGFSNSDTLSGVDLQTATLAGNNPGAQPPLIFYETDVITSVTPVPEPADVSFCGAGLLGIVLLRRWLSKLSGLDSLRDLFVFFDFAVVDRITRRARREQFATMFGPP